MYNVQYIVVRRDIADKYGFGFLASQICHACIAPITNPIRKADRNAPISSLYDKDTFEWIDNTFYKCLLEIENLDKLNMLRDRLDSDGIEYIPIVESKIKELTVIGLKPYNKGRVAPYFKDLKLLGKDIPE